MVTFAYRGRLERGLLLDAVPAVPDQPGIVCLFVGHRRRMTLLVKEVLTSVALHQLVPALLVEHLAHAARAVVETLEIHLHLFGPRRVLVPRCFTPRSWRSRRWSVGL